MGDARSQDLHQGVEGVVGPVLPEVPLRSLTSIHKGGLLAYGYWIMVVSPHARLILP